MILFGNPGPAATEHPMEVLGAIVAMVVMVVAVLLVLGVLTLGVAYICYRHEMLNKRGSE